jgi:transposase
MTHPFADCCPECGYLTGVPPGAPYTVQNLEAPHVRALYRCSYCGHTWHTSWNAEFVLGHQESAGGAA